MDKKGHVIVVTGPTASGKSALAIQLCKRWDGEVVCADSMQLYRGMDVGTAKPAKDEQDGIPHHLMDILEPTRTFSVADYKREADKVIRDILSRGKRPVLCGGTGQYLSTMIEGTEYTPFNNSESMRAGLEKELQEKGIDPLYEELLSIDPYAASLLHRNDTKRILRAIEVFRLTGMTKTQLNGISREKGPDFVFTSFCLSHDRDILYDRINRRVDSMLEHGLLDEIRRLITDYPILSNTACQAIGYKEFIPVIQGKISLEEAADSVKQATRNYAKRQLTWFRKMDGLTWIMNQDTGQAAATILKDVEKGLFE